MTEPKLGRNTSQFERGALTIPYCESSSRDSKDITRWCAYQHLAGWPSSPNCPYQLSPSLHQLQLNPFHFSLLAPEYPTVLKTPDHNIQYIRIYPIAKGQAFVVPIAKC